jgi:hypothetical protein
MAGAADRADGQAAADDLAEGHEVRAHPEAMRRAFIGLPEVQHFIVDEQYAVPLRDLAQELEIVSLDRHEPDPARHQIHQYAGELRRVRFEQRACIRNVVERKDDNLVQHARRRPSIGRSGTRLPGGTPVRRVRRFTDLGPVIAAVVSAFELRDFLATGERSRSLDGEHHGFSAGVHESHGFEARHPPDEQLRQLDLEASRVGKAGAEAHRLGYRLHDGRIAVPMDQSGEIVVEIEIAIAVGIHDARAFATLRVDRVGLAMDGDPGGTVRKNMAGPRGEARRAGTLLEARCTGVARSHLHCQPVSRERLGCRTGRDYTVCSLM